MVILAAVGVELLFEYAFMMMNVYLYHHYIADLLYALCRFTSDLLLRCRSVSIHPAANNAENNEAYTVHTTTQTISFESSFLIVELVSISQLKAKVRIAQTTIIPIAIDRLFFSIVTRLTTPIPMEISDAEIR